jgi:outer membrane protein assembly factor BamB
MNRYLATIGFTVIAVAATTGAQDVRLPATPLQFGLFQARFNADGTFSLEGQGWPAFKGTWKTAGPEVTLLTAMPQAKCDGPGRYRVEGSGTRVTLALVTDDCVPRRMILDRSTWRPLGEADPKPERRIVRSGPDKPPRLHRPAAAAGSWPSFRGPQASGAADGRPLPDRWSAASGENILWRTPIPGLAHSSPIVWGDRIFVTTAVSSKPNATFRPGLYGDGDASDDRSRHKWILMALDARTGKVVWERVAHEGEPREKRHIKSTYASSTPATDGRIVVASFGSHGVHAYDVDGNSLWKVDLGRLDIGAYDIPTFEWGPASSPIVWNGLVLLQCDTQADSFIVALDAGTGKTVWKTERDEFPSWGTPTVAVTPSGPQVVANGAKFVRGYDPATGKELWRLGGSSKITAPTPIFADGVFVVASGRQPERPVFVVRPDARGDITLKEGETSSAAVAWSRTGRGPYMPTPLAYKGILYVLANNGLFDAYDLKTGKEIYRQRLTHLGSGFSASPVAANDRIYLSNEDGEIQVVAAGSTFAHVATNTMGDLLMATPALSNGVMYVRSAGALFAIGQRQ